MSRGDLLIAESEYASKFRNSRLYRGLLRE